MIISKITKIIIKNCLKNKMNKLYKTNFYFLFDLKLNILLY